MSEKLHVPDDSAEQRLLSLEKQKVQILRELTEIQHVEGKVAELESLIEAFKNADLSIIADLSTMDEETASAYVDQMKQTQYPVWQQKIKNIQETLNTTTEKYLNTKLEELFSVLQKMHNLSSYDGTI